MQAFNHLDKGDTFPVDETVDSADAGAFDALVLPGGVANPDCAAHAAGRRRLRQGLLRRGQAGRRDLPRARGRSSRPACWRGRTLTSWPSLQTDIRNAGGTWVDEEVVVDDSAAAVLVTSRNPDDLPAFGKALVAAFAG